MPSKPALRSIQRFDELGCRTGKGVLGAKGVIAALDDEKLARWSRLFDQEPGLVDGHRLVVVAVDDQPGGFSVGRGAYRKEGGAVSLQIP
jgi:hypothetical protein